MVLFVNVETVRIFEEFGKEVCFTKAALVQITFTRGRRQGMGRENMKPSMPLFVLKLI